MFTGIVEERGRVRSMADGRLVVECRTVAGDAELGASVSVNGVCLTVVANEDGVLAFDVVPETLTRSGLGSLRSGDPVNLERAATLATRLGGHLVQGHADGMGTIDGVERNGGGVTMTIRLPADLTRYVVEKGSIAVDGVSLTVAGVDGDRFSVALVPHTLEATTLGDRAPGDSVNLEVDVVSKYVERLLEVKR